MDRIMILTNTLPHESNISVIYKGDVAVVVARDNQERLLFKVITTVATNITKVIVMSISRMCLHILLLTVLPHKAIRL